MYILKILMIMWFSYFFAVMVIFSRNALYSILSLVFLIVIGFCFVLLLEIDFLSLSPSIGIGCIWPPTAVSTISAWGLPLWKTISVLFYMTSGKLNKTVVFFFYLLIVLINVFITLIFFKDEKFTKKLQNFSLLTLVVTLLLFLIILVVFDNINDFSKFLNSLYELKQLLISIYFIIFNVYCPLYALYVVLLKILHWVPVKRKFFFHYNDTNLVLAIAFFLNWAVQTDFSAIPIIHNIVRGQTAYYVSNFLYWWFWPMSIIEPVPTEVVDVMVEEALPSVYHALNLCVYLFAIGDCVWCLYSIWHCR